MNGYDPKNPPIKFSKVGPGHYRSFDGVFEIQATYGHSRRNGDFATRWYVYHHGRVLSIDTYRGACYEGSLADAVRSLCGIIGKAIRQAFEPLYKQRLEQQERDRRAAEDAAEQRKLAELLTAIVGVLPSSADEAARALIAAGVHVNRSICGGAL